MKLLYTAMVGTLLLGSGVVVAGENCFYGRDQASLASIDSSDKAESSLAAELANPKLLALQKKREAEQHRTGQSAPIIHN